MAKKTVGKTIRRKTVHVTLPSGEVRRIQMFHYDLQPHIPTPWYFRAADAIIHAAEDVEDAIAKAWAALGKVIANGDFHHRS